MKVLIAISHRGETTTRAIEVTDRATLVYSVAAEVIDFVGKEAAVQHHYEMVHYQLENPDGSVIASGIPQFQADLGIPDEDGVLKIKLEITPKKFEAIRSAINQLLETDTVKNREKAKQCIKKSVEDGTIALHLPALREYLQKNAKDDKGKQKPVVNEVRSWLNEATPLVDLSAEDMELLIQELQQEKPDVEFIKNTLQGVTSLSLPDCGIRDSGAQALAEVLKSNATLISLELGRNLIGSLGAQALAEALKSNATLAYLNLKHNQINESGAQYLAESLKSNTTLTSLNLSYNHIRDSGVTELALALESNTTLISFDLGGNEIRDSGATALAKALKSNTSLISLDLQFNQIGVLGVIKIAEALKSNATLTSLNLKHNQTGTSGAKYLAEALKSNATLTSLNLSHSQIGIPGAQHLAEALKSNVTLSSLHLGNNEIGAPGAQALTEALKSNFSLIHLDLDLPYFSDKGKIIIGYLQRNKKRLATATQYLERTFVLDVTPEINLIAPLTEIIGGYLIPNDLTSECDIFETIRIAISNLLETDTEENRENAKKCIKMAAQDGTIVPHLAALREYLQKNAKDDKGKQKPLVNELCSWLYEATPLVELSTKGRELLIQELQEKKPSVKFIKKTLHGVTSLSIPNSGIRDSGAQALAEALKSNATLIFLELGKNHIGALGTQALAEALKSDTTLYSLNLNYNEIGESGAKYLAEALKSNSTLRMLHLSANHIGSLGAKHFAESLKSNTTLTNLDLAVENQIGDSGATELAEALKSNATLRSLYLQFNQIGVPGVTRISEALKTNSTLASLNLRFNDEIGDLGVTELAEVLKSNTTLTSLNLDFTEIGISGAQHLAEALKSNTTLSSLSLVGNQIGVPGATALTEAFKSNFSLISLDLPYSYFSDKGKITDYLQKNKKRLATATEYLERIFVKDVTPEINLTAPLTEIIGGYLIPTDLTSECDITGSAALMCQLGFHQTYSEKEKESLEGTLEDSSKKSSLILD